MANDVSDRLDRMLAGMQAREEIKCPACGYVYVGDDLYSLATFHGDGEPKDDNCPSCDALLVIDETVTREYDVKIKE